MVPVLPDGSALVRQGDVLGALGPDWTIRWMALAIRAGTRIVSIGPRGAVRCGPATSE